MWNDVNSHKMYVTGGLGSLYDGTSPDGTSYNPNDVQKIHQALGAIINCQILPHTTKPVQMLAMCFGTGGCFNLPEMQNMPI